MRRSHAARRWRSSICAYKTPKRVWKRELRSTRALIVGPSRVGSRTSMEVRGPPVTTAGALAQSLRREAVAATERTRQSAGGFATMEVLATHHISGTPKEERLYEVREINQGDPVALAGREATLAFHRQGNSVPTSQPRLARSYRR